MAQRDDFQSGAHLRDLFDGVGIERRNSNAAARYADHEVLRFQLSKGFAHRDVA